MRTSRRYLVPSLAVLGLTALLILLAGQMVLPAGAVPIVKGYQDFSYAPVPPAPDPHDPTGEKPESKLWWNDGFWWGSMFNVTAGEYRIYRLNWGTQEWEDTGVALDDRDDSRADTLWDTTDNKLYVASHIYTENSAPADPGNRGRLYRYSYNTTTDTYSLDGGFHPDGVDVNVDKTEALVLDKDSTGRLWVTYVSRVGIGIDNPYQVYVNATTGGALGDDDNWGTPFTLPTEPVEKAHVAQDDIASLISFGGKIGVMWSNQVDNTLNFATHLDSNPDPDDPAGWTLHANILAGHTVDDHISLKMHAAGGKVFAAIKTNPPPLSTDPLIGLIVKDADDNFSFKTYSTKANDDTRPIVLVDESAALVYMFVTGKPGGSKICYKSSPLSAISFPAGDCGTSFIEDSVLDKIDNATSAKQNLNATTGIVVLASDDVNGQYYVHNVLGDPPPVVTDRLPANGATNVPVNTTVSATFSKPMDATTLTPARFTVTGSGGPVDGTRIYDGVTRTWTFTPSIPLSGNSTYTVTVKGQVNDTTGHALYGGDEVWTFTTGAAPTNTPTATSSPTPTSTQTPTATATPPGGGFSIFLPLVENED